MRTATARRVHPRAASSPEPAMFRREQQREPAFFGGGQAEPFFNSTGSHTTAAIQRKCEACSQAGSQEDEKVQRAPEKKEDEKLQKKEASGGGGVEGSTSAYVQSIGATGRPMPPELLQFYGTRMDHDFSGVRLHTGRDASDSANDIGARAYTYTNHVVFNEGQYRPETQDGRHLLAHELAHVAQQNGGINRDRINRVPAGFDIQGVFPDAASFPSTIFFDLGSASIPATERPKIPGIAAPAARDITLIGTSSEEGTPGSNTALINQRINHVDGALAGASHTGVRTKTPQPTAGTGNIDYRRVRAVDVITTPAVVPPGGALPSSTPACTPTPANPTPEVEPCGASLTGAWPNALRWTLTAFVQMAMGAPSAIAEAGVLFPGIAPGVISGHLGSLVGQVAGLPGHHQCHNTCDGGCSRPAYNTGTGGAQMMTLCPGYIDSTNVNEQSETLIHESLHATPGLATADTAYATTRLITSLTGPQALNNTDSFVLLVLRINGIAPPGGATPGDTSTGFTGATGPTEQKHAADSLAFLEQWLLNAEFDTSLVYSAMDRNIGGAGWAASDNFEGEIAHLISALAGITDPGPAAPFATAPVLNDKVKIAGMFDRYTLMRQEVYMRSFTLNRSTSGTDRCDLATRTFFLNSAFFSMSQEDSVRHLLRLLVTALGTVPSAQRGAYIESANEIRKHRSTGP